MDRLYDGILIGIIIGFIIGAVIQMLYDVNTMWEEGYDAAKKHYSNWNDGFDAGWDGCSKTLSEMISKYAIEYNNTLNKQKQKENRK